MRVEQWNPAREGPLEERALRKKLEARGYAVTPYRYPPGTYFPPHSHELDKIDAVLRGRFRVVIGDEDRVLEPGDALFVPAGMVHSAEVIGDEEVVSLDATKA